MKKVADEIPAYTYGTTAVAASPVTLDDLEKLKVSAGFTAEDEQFLRLAGEVLADQAKQIVLHWRSGDHREHSQSRQTFAHAGRGANSGVSREEQSAISAVDFGYLSSTVRPGLT